MTEYRMVAPPEPDDNSDLIDTLGYLWYKQGKYYICNHPQQVAKEYTWDDLIEQRGPLTVNDTVEVSFTRAELNDVIDALHNCSYDKLAERLEEL